MDILRTEIPKELINNGITRNEINNKVNNKLTPFGRTILSLEEMSNIYPEEFNKRLSDIENGDYRGLLGTIIYNIVCGLNSPIPKEERDEMYISDAEAKELAIKLGKIKFGTPPINLNIESIILELDIDLYTKEILGKTFLQKSDHTKLIYLHKFLKNIGQGVDFMSKDDELKLYYLILLLEKELDNKIYEGNIIHTIEERNKIDKARKKIKEI